MTNAACTAKVSPASTLEPRLASPSSSTSGASSDSPESRYAPRPGPSRAHPRTVLTQSGQRTCLLITLHYIDQISLRLPVFVLSSLTCHRFVIASIVVSSKCLCDAFSSNSVYAKVGGIPVAELNVLEREFLRMIDWNLTVSTSPCTSPARPPPSRTR